jgi:hypothetical protein
MDAERRAPVITEKDTRVREMRRDVPEELAQELTHPQPQLEVASDEAAVKD